MEFGYFTLSDNHYPNNPRSANEFVLQIREQAVLADQLGMHSAWIGEHHFDSLGVNSRPDLLLANIASQTKRIRLAPAVTVLPLHHPVHVAEAWATLDLLSGGRLEIGVGAGWMTTDYEQAGIPLDPPGRRIRRLAEALDVLEGLWADGPLTHQGEHYRITGLDGRPKPVQRPRPPLVLGGGARRMLTLAGRRADIVGINVSLAKGVIDADAGPDGTAERTEEKVGWVRAAAGDRFGDIEHASELERGNSLCVEREAVVFDGHVNVALLQPSDFVDPLPERVAVAVDARTPLH